VPSDDNRWQRGHVVDALYLCENTDCVWAEWYRHLAERGVPPRYALPRDAWTYAIRQLEVTDLSTAERLARVDLPTPAPGPHTWPPFQTVGEQLHREGFAGILATSAAHPPSLVLCIFLPACAVPQDLVPERPPERVTEAPPPPTGTRT
jgi:hypothetical protein